MYIFPRAMHADLPSIREQIKHLDSEAVEVKLVYVTPDINDVAKELYDVIHSAETCVRMLDERGCVDDVAAVMTLGWEPLPVGAMYEMIKRISSRIGNALDDFDNGNVHTLVWDLRDVIEHAKAALGTLSSVYHVDIDVCRLEVIKKNTDRGYYNLAQTSRPAGAHSCSRGRSLPAAPLHPAEKENQSNRPKGGR